MKNKIEEMAFIGLSRDPRFLKEKIKTSKKEDKLKEVISVETEINQEINK